MKLNTLTNFIKKSYKNKIVKESAGAIIFVAWAGLVAYGIQLKHAANADQVSYNNYNAPEKGIADNDVLVTPVDGVTMNTTNGNIEIDISKLPYDEEIYLRLNKLNLLKELENTPKELRIDFKLSNQQKQAAKKLSKTFNQHLDKSKVYLSYIINELKKNNLPVELAVIPMIESNYNPHAISNAGAKGYWQFVKITGKEYNLKESQHYSDYKDIVKSTQAAINLFKHLHEVFNDWNKVITAYNIGEFALKKNPQKVNSKYLNKFKIYAELLMNSSKYNINIKIKNKSTFVKVPGHVFTSNNLKTIDHAAKKMNIDPDKLRALNAGYKTNIIDQHGLLVPRQEFMHLFAKAEKADK